MKVVLAACALLSVFAPVAKASDITYTFNQLVTANDGSGDQFTVTGTLSTDGTIGALAAGDIVGYDLTVVETFYDPVDASMFTTANFTIDSSNGGTLFDQGGLVGSSNSLFFEFDSGPPVNALFQTGVVGHYDSLGFYNGTEGAGAAGVGSTRKIGGNSDQIATVVPAATPEPGGLMLLGTGALGVVGMLRRRVFKS
jgi:hypothetical protein